MAVEELVGAKSRSVRFEIPLMSCDIHTYGGTVIMGFAVLVEVGGKRSQTAYGWCIVKIGGLQRTMRRDMVAGRLVLVEIQCKVNL